MKMMKKAVICGVKEAKVIEVPKPQPKEDWVMVKVHAIPICTEYKGWLSGNEYHGHEAAGEVVEVAQPGKVKVGDRVVVMPGIPCGKCSYCISGEYIHCQDNYDYKKFTGTDGSTDTHVQYLIKPSWLLTPIPDGVPYELASLACCGIGPTFGACENMNISVFDTVMIVGGGPVGLGGVVNVKYRGAKVIIVEPVPYRQEKAKELGADLVLDPNDKEIREKIMSFTDGLGVDACMECVGSIQAQRLCLDVTRRKGKIALIGECGDDLKVEASADFIRTGISIFGQWHYNLNDAFKIMEVIKNSPVIDKLITHVLPMGKIQDALALDATHQSGKIILNPWK